MVTGRDPMMGETRTCACAPSASAVAGPNQRTTIKARGHPIRFYEAGPMTAPRPTSRQDVEKVLAMLAGLKTFSMRGTLRPDGWGSSYKGVVRTARWEL